MIASVSDVTGIGIYSPAEAALYARIHQQTLRRWVFGASNGEAVIEHQTQDGTVTFQDFVQTLAIRAIRQQHNVALPKIRSAIQFAEQSYGLRFPLARRHTMFLMGRELVICPDGERYVLATGKSRSNLLIKQIAEPFLQELTFDDSGFASRYNLLRWGDFTATMDPSVQFGQPYLQECGVSTLALYEAFQSEGSIEAAADVYDVTPDAVRFACRLYVDYLPLTAA